MKRFSFTVAVATIMFGMTVRSAHAITIPTIGTMELGNYLKLLQDYAEEQAKQNLQRIINGESLQVTGTKELAGKMSSKFGQDLKDSWPDIQKELFGKNKVSKEEEQIGLTEEVQEDPEKLADKLEEIGDKAEKDAKFRAECRKATAEMAKKGFRKVFAMGTKKFFSAANDEVTKKLTDITNGSSTEMALAEAGQQIAMTQAQEEAKKAGEKGAEMAAKYATSICGK